MGNTKQTLLIVDDEVEICELLGHTFEKLGFSTLKAHTAEEALKLVRTQKIDVIVSDIQMPGGGGVHLLDEVKKLQPHAPIMFLMTGYSELSIEDAFDKGAEAVFPKPFDRKALIGTISKILEAKEKYHGRPLREEADLKIEVQLDKEASPKKGRVKNMGRGGFFVSFDGTYPKVGDTLVFRLSLEGETCAEVKGRGTVRWVHPQLAGCGIEFAAFEGAGRANILTFINSLRVKSIPSKK